MIFIIAILEFEFIITTFTRPNLTQESMTNNKQSESSWKQSIIGWVIPVALAVLTSWSAVKGELSAVKQEQAKIEASICMKEKTDDIIVRKLEAIQADLAIVKSDVKLLSATKVDKFQDNDKK